jgi:hypothetical protein
MNNHKRFRETVAFVRSLGVLDARIEQGGKHPHLVGTTADGRALRYVLAGSPSDGRRGQRNVEAVLRRACRSGPADEPRQAGERRHRRRRSGRRAQSHEAAGRPAAVAGDVRAATPSSPFDVPAMHALRQRLQAVEAAR